MPSRVQILFFLKTVILPICKHINFVHKMGIIHRDLTRKNIMIKMKKSEIVPIVIDWGVAVKYPVEQIIPSHTSIMQLPVNTHTAFGNMGIPPEMRRGQQPTVATDIYMLGHIIYYVTTGDLAVMPLTQDDYTLKPKVRNPETPEVLNQLVKKMTQFEPFDRITPVAAIIDILLSIIEPAKQETQYNFSLD